MHRRSPEPGHEELHAIVRGHVQGVFFRATAQEHARALGLVGTVRNRDDGSVELFAQGFRKDLKLLIELLKKEPGMAEVEEIEETYGEPNEYHDEFHIVFW